MTGRVQSMPGFAMRMSWSSAWAGWKNGLLTLNVGNCLRLIDLVGLPYKFSDVNLRPACSISHLEVNTHNPYADTKIDPIPAYPAQPGLQ
jgi:hypothetical protein